MTSLKWAASLLALSLSLVGSTGVAHADPPKAPAAAQGGQGIMAFPSLRYQIRESAKAAGVYPKGSYPTLRLTHNANGTVSAMTTVRSTFGGGGAPLPHAQRFPNATATFKVQQLPDGQLAVPVKQNGQVWQPIYRLMKAAPAAAK